MISWSYWKTWDASKRVTSCIHTVVNEDLLLAWTPKPPQLFPPECSRTDSKKKKIFFANLLQLYSGKSPHNLHLEETGGLNGDILAYCKNFYAVTYCTKTSCYVTISFSLLLFDCPLGEQVAFTLCVIWCSHFVFNILTSKSIECKWDIFKLG